MDSIEARFRRQRSAARNEALGVVLFALIGVPWVLRDGASSGSLVGLAPGLAVAVVWIVLAVRMARYAQGWTKLPNSPLGLRAGLEGGKRINARQAIDYLTAFFALWLPWKLAADWSMYQSEPWRAAVGIGGFGLLAGCLRWCFVQHERGIDAQIAAIP